MLAPIVALAIVLLFAAAVILPPRPPVATIGALPLGEGAYSLGLDGTYFAPCFGGSIPIRWAVFLYQSNRSNTTFHLSGAWTASRPTLVQFGFSTNITSVSVLRDWGPIIHCPLVPPNYTPPVPQPPPLPISGSVDDRITTLPDATLFLLVVRTFDPSDVFVVTEPFTVTAG